eukprot:TRINITY_DN111166_c0_g1_i1.p1 TRINITY_DN111166_c0_g1~~TRINITY_DN111166_c0_g1_i1.p1  ORF type:complete len:174 (+),score=18.91 TRINITY_DN111166_c0_g1_i1:84-605(+)
MSHGERMLEIVGGVGPTVNRLHLKTQMEQFGQVDVVHMGNRNNPEAEPPKVRFVKAEHAQKALDAINAQTVCVNGVFIQARFKESKGAGRGGGSGGTSTSRGKDPPADRAEFSSRDVMSSRKEPSRSRERRDSRARERRDRSRSRDRRSRDRRSRDRGRGRSRSDSRDRRRRR